MNYAAEYNTYWSRGDRLGESSGNLQQTADEILLTCGGGAILDVGSGEGALVRALLDRGAAAIGVDVSEIVVARCNKRAPGCFVHGSILSLPFENEIFETVVSTDCMEHLAPEDVPCALREIHRVARRNVFLQIATTRDRDDHWHLTVEGRSWWETRCFEAGFRKHPAYYKINDYESLNEDGWQICILLEKLPVVAVHDYPLASLNEERGLHMDMLRDGGERSDAHVVRYHWACDYIKPGDRVLDAACGLGYGGRVIRHNTRASKIVGVDGSEYAIDYATKSFPDEEGRVEYQMGMLPEALSSFEDGSFDAIVSFETLEHVLDPEALLREFYRLLAPGGRILVSVPNDWSDETGEDPNPYHLHVYDWRRLKSEISANFILEEAFAQTASQCKVSANGGTWERRQRALRKVEITEGSPVDCEWWLMVAMKSPIASGGSYTERVFANIATSSHPSTRYADYFNSPWLMHAMVNVSYRVRNPEALGALAKEVLENSPKCSNDYLAALCVFAYRTLEERGSDSSSIEGVIRLINEVVDVPTADPMGFRWKVSLLFVKGKLFQTIGNLTDARAAFVECASHDVRTFGVHLATKTTEALFIAGRLAYSMGESNEALVCWERGVALGDQLLSVSLDDILISRHQPNRFNDGDGVREYAIAWDNIARCANGLNLLSNSDTIDDTLLHGSLQTEYAIVTRDLVACRKQLGGETFQLIEDRRTLEERTRLLEASNRELENRTAQLDRCNVDLLELTQDLVVTRQVLSERTLLLEAANLEVRKRTDELIATREQLVERAGLLELHKQDLLASTGELVETRDALAERTESLERVADDLAGRTKLLVEANDELTVQDRVLVETRETLAERTESLELVIADLEGRTKLLVKANDELAVQDRVLEETRETLAERTESLERVAGELAGRTKLLVEANDELAVQNRVLVETRETLAERTESLERGAGELAGRTELLVEANDELAVQDRVLVETRETLAERTESLERVAGELAGRTKLLVEANDELAVQNRVLVETRETLAERTESLERVADELAGRTKLLVEANDERAVQSRVLVETRETLAERTESLERVADELAGRTKLMVEANDELAVQNRVLVETRETLAERTRLLEQTRQLLEQRVELLKQSQEELTTRTAELCNTRQALADRTRKLEFASLELAKYSQGKLKGLWHLMRGK